MNTIILVIGIVLFVIGLILLAVAVFYSGKKNRGQTGYKAPEPAEGEEAPKVATADEIKSNKTTYYALLISGIVVMVSGLGIGIFGAVKKSKPKVAPAQNGY
jgi:flagellar basal body-associated protein FliL